MPDLQSAWSARCNVPPASTRRFEHKYRLDLATCCKLRSALKPYARHCPFSAPLPDSRYLVRSLYFDTYDYQAYVEKVTGCPNRIKLRLRCYASKRDQLRFVSVELKTRFGFLVEKFATRVGPADCDHFLKRRDWLSQANPVLDEFRRLVLLGDRRPKLLVDYYREAWLSKDGSSARITLDHAVTYARAETLFPQSPFFRRPNPRWVILEIKIDDALPGWLERIVRAYGLKSVPNSKYAQGIELTQHALWGRAAG